MKHILKFFILVFCLLSISVIHAAEFKAFGGNSLADIEQSNKGKPFVLAFWSVDCPYCIDEMKALGETLRHYPQVKLVTVCADSLGKSTEMAKVLNQASLPAHERWQFAEDDEERLRYVIDKRWGGELPRTYFYNAQHQVKAISGTPPVGWLPAWLKNL